VPQATAQTTRRPGEQVDKNGMFAGPPHRRISGYFPREEAGLLNRDA
jgi:hypothetical protein